MERLMMIDEITKDCILELKYKDIDKLDRDKGIVILKNNEFSFEEINPYVEDKIEHKDEAFEMEYKNIVRNSFVQECEEEFDLAYLQPEDRDFSKMTIEQIDEEGYLFKTLVSISYSLHIAKINFLNGFREYLWTGNSFLIKPLGEWSDIHNEVLPVKNVYASPIDLTKRYLYWRERPIISSWVLTYLRPNTSIERDKTLRLRHYSVLCRCLLRNEPLDL